MRWIAVLLLCCPAVADDSLLRLVEAKIACEQRVTALEARVLQLEQALKGGGPNTSRSGHDAALLPGPDAPAPQESTVNSTPAETASNGSPAGRTDKPAATPTSPPASSTAVCQCRGNDANRAVCFCLKAGVQCHCSRDVGSVWRVEGGKAVAKTGAKANPNQAAFDAEWDRRVKARQDAQERPETPVAKQDEPEAKPAATEGYAITRNGRRAFWKDSTGKGWYTDSELRAGMLYGGRFRYEGGRMVESGTAPKVEPVIPQQGYWQTQCFGGQCHRVWVPFAPLGQ